MSVFIFSGIPEERRPTQVVFISLMASQTLFTHGTFIPGRPFTWHFSQRFTLGWHFISVLRAEMKSCKQQQENDQIPRWIHPGTKWVISGRKLSCKRKQHREPDAKTSRETPITSLFYQNDNHCASTRALSNCDSKHFQKMCNLPPINKHSIGQQKQNGYQWQNITWKYHACG